MKTLEQVEIFAVGTWNGAKFIEEDLQEIANNTNTLLAKSSHKPPVKLGHSKKQILAQDDGQPALGWVENFKVQGKKLIADIKNVPDILINSIKNELFKQVSIELTHHRNFGWFASGLSILGADLPAVKSLKDLQLYLSEKKENDLPDKINGDLVLNFSTPIFIKDEMDNKKELELEKKESEFKEKEKELAAKAELLSKKMNELSFSEEKSIVVSVFEKLQSKGILTPAVFGEIEKEIEAQRGNFSEGDKIAFSPELLEKVISSQDKKEEFGETKEIEQPEVEELSTIDKIDSLIQEEVKSGMHYVDAMNKVFTENPDLSEAYYKLSTDGVK